MSNFIQIHALVSYPASLLNRDDAGMAKRIPFGGATRTRISSQCLKKHWRSHDGAEAIRAVGLPMTIRSRRTFAEYIAKPLVAGGVSEAVALKIAAAIQGLAMAKNEAKAKAAAKAAEDGAEATGDEVETSQVTVLGVKELEVLLELAEGWLTEGDISSAVNAFERAPGDRKAAKALDDALKAKADAAKKDKAWLENLKAMGEQALSVGLDGALFGRMVTSDILRARIDGAIHVAHAFTVHSENAEQDYFSAVDELKGSHDDAGSGHINASELDTGLYYVYVVVDRRQLLKNLGSSDAYGWQGEDHELGAELVRRLTKMIATVSPGAKRGSTAPYAYASAVVVEAGDGQPRTLANAFLEAVPQRGNVLANAYRALSRQLADLDRMYGASWQRMAAATGPAGELGIDGAGERSLDEVANFAAHAVRGG